MNMRCRTNQYQALQMETSINGLCVGKFCDYTFISVYGEGSIAALPDFE